MRGYVFKGPNFTNSTSANPGNSKRCPWAGEGWGDCSHLIVTIGWLLENFNCWCHHAAIRTCNLELWPRGGSRTQLFSLNFRTGPPMESRQNFPKEHVWNSDSQSSPLWPSPWNSEHLYFEWVSQWFSWINDLINSRWVFHEISRNLSLLDSANK